MTLIPDLGRRGEGWVAIQVVLLVLIGAAGWFLGPDWSGPLRLLGIMLGIALLAGGTILGIRGVLDLGRALTPAPRPRASATLVVTGVYGLARHPIYGGLILASAGWSIMQASVLAVIGTVVLVAFFRLKSAREEAWLSERFPEYPAYRDRTRRFIPWLY